MSEVEAPIVKRSHVKRQTPNLNRPGNFGKSNSRKSRTPVGSIRSFERGMIQNSPRSSNHSSNMDDRLYPNISRPASKPASLKGYKGSQPSISKSRKQEEPLLIS